MTVPTGMRRIGKQFPGFMATDRRIPKSMTGGSLAGVVGVVGADPGK